MSTYATYPPKNIVPNLDGTYLRLDGTNSPTADISWGGHSLLNLSTITDSSNILSVDVSNRKLYDGQSPNDVSVDYGGRVLKDRAGAFSVNWANYFLANNGTNAVVDWYNLVLNDNSANLSIDWVSRHLADNNGTVLIDWHTPGSFLVKGLLSLNGSTSGAMSMQAAGTTTTYTVTMPSAQGASNTFLKNDGSGNLSWSTVSAGANTTLSNLTSPTAINQNLEFSVDGTYTIGTSTDLRPLAIYSAGDIWAQSDKFKLQTDGGAIVMSGAPYLLLKEGSNTDGFIAAGGMYHIHQGAIKADLWGNAAALSLYGTTGLQWITDNNADIGLAGSARPRTIYVGTGLAVSESANGKQGIVTLVGGTATVSNTHVTTNSRIFLTAQSLGTVIIPNALAVTARTASTSFTITSADSTDTSVVAYEIFEPG